MCDVMMEKMGRKKTLFVGLMGSGLFCILTNVVPGKIYKTSSFVIGKLLISIAFTCIYIFTMEIFPTNLRHRFFSICSIFGCIGSILAPLTPLLIGIHSSLPLFFFAFFSFTSSLILFYLPETVNRKLPETTQQAFNWVYYWFVLKQYQLFFGRVW
jgi:MFS family permease